MTHFTFDDNQYNNTPEDQQQLLEDVYDALTTEAISDPENLRDTPDQTGQAISEAVEMSFDGTDYRMSFRENLMAIMQQAPYEIDIQFHGEEMD